MSNHLLRCGSSCSSQYFLICLHNYILYSALNRRHPNTAKHTAYTVHFQTQLGICAVYNGAAYNGKLNTIYWNTMQLLCHYSPRLSKCYCVFVEIVRNVYTKLSVYYWDHTSICGFVLSHSSLHPSCFRLPPTCWDNKLYKPFCLDFALPTGTIPCRNRTHF